MKNKAVCHDACAVYGDRKGKYIEDVVGNCLCSCGPVWKEHNCAKSKLLTLHRINSMPESMKWAVITKINLTRQGSKGKRWHTAKEVVICNVHYSHCIGPTKANRNLITVYFKRPGEHLTPSIPKQGRNDSSSICIVLVP